tara:strand:+ start:552 stop:815 length:264 start_codon:yes stop_codon:yes gene_type:complete
MAIKKGDLVLLKSGDEELIPGLNPGSILIVTKGPYEKQFHQPGFGIKYDFSSLVLAVDLIHDGDFVKGVPVKHLVRAQEIIVEEDNE